MKAKVLLYDIETSPIVSFNWGIYEQNAIEMIQDWTILCFSYKWLGQKRIKNIAQWDFEDYKPGIENLDDFQVVGMLRDLFDEADVVIAHNGDSFDQKKSQARMMVHNMEPPSPYRQLDTKKIAKRYGNFTSNRLDHLNKGFGFEGKIDPGGFKTWKGCMVGDPKMQKKMVYYNNKDVEELEKLYLHLRPWIQNHPFINVIEGKPENCKNCGSGEMQVKNGKYYTRKGFKKQIQCLDCGAWDNYPVLEKV